MKQNENELTKRNDLGYDGIMTEQPESEIDTTADAGAVTSEDASGEAAGCVFPTGPKAVCGRPPALAEDQVGKPGRKSSYCDTPGHNRTKAFAVRRKYELQAAGLPAEQAVEAVPSHPVSVSRMSLEALLETFERLTAQHRSEYSAIVTKAEALVRTVTDPEAAGHEVAAAHREARKQIDEAATAQATAEQAAGKARRAAEAAVEQKAQADEAAEEALAELQKVQERTAEQLAEANTKVEASAADQRKALEDLENVRKAAAQAVTTAEDEARKGIQHALDEQRRIIGEHQAAAADSIERAHAELEDAQAKANDLVKAEKERADKAIAAAAKQVTEADRLRIRAEADRDAAVATAATDRQTVDRLTAELTTERAAARKQRDEDAARLAELQKALDTARDQAVVHAAAAVQDKETAVAAARADVKQVVDRLDSELKELRGELSKERERTDAAQRAMQGERERYAAQIEQLTTALTEARTAPAPKPGK